MKMNSLCWLPTFYVQKQATLIKFFNKQTPINCWMPYTAFARNMMERSWNIACIKWHAHIQSWINSLKLNHHEISESQCFKALIKIEQTNKQKNKNKKQKNVLKYTCKELWLSVVRNSTKQSTFNRNTFCYTAPNCFCDDKPIGLSVLSENIILPKICSFSVYL